MTTALVITSTPQSKELVRSDTVAAKVLQNAIKDGRGSDVLTPKPVSAAPKSASSGATSESVSKPLAGTTVSDRTSAGIPNPYNSASIDAMRARIADMTQALASLKQAFEDMVGYRSMIMESDSATAIAFAGNVLENVERESEAAEVSAEVDAAAAKGEGGEKIVLAGTERGDFIVADGSLVHRVEAGSSDDGINAKGEIVRHISGGEGSDGVFVQARRAVDITGGSGDDAIAVESMMAWGVAGGSGDDKLHVMAEKAGNISGGRGDDTISVQGLRVNDVRAGSGDDRMSIVGKNVTNISDGDGDDVVSIRAEKLGGLETSKGDDVYNLDVGQAKMTLREGMGNDVVNLATGSHLNFALSDSEMMVRGAMNAVWDGNDLKIEFENGDSLTINNAANAGSISMKAGGTTLTLQAPKVPAESGLLDIAV